MKKCENCNKKFDDELNFCPICGTKLSTNEEKINFCPICGKELEEDANFCPACGNPTKKHNNESYVNCHNGTQAMRPPVQGVGVIMAFMIISCIINLGLCITYWVSAQYLAMFVIGILPFIWKIPMISHFYNLSNQFIKASTPFKVCVLLFVSFISGIILLCNNDI